jgi:outer membrane protein assembly factor BamB
VVSGGRVFVSDAVLEKPLARERLLCFDEETGKRLWAFEYVAPYPDWAFVPGQGGGPTATPIVQGGRVYMLGANGEVHCLEVETGAVTWSRKLGEEFEIGSMGCRASPLLDAGRLILFTGAKPDASVMALDPETGATLWQAMDEGISNSSPMILKRVDGHHLIVWTTASVFSLNPATGALDWREPMITSNNDCVSTPVSHGDRLLIGGLMMEYRPGEVKPAILWPADRKIALKRILSNTSTALYLDGHVYSPRMRGELVCLDAATGLELWQKVGITEPKSGASIHLTPTAAGAVYLFTDEGVLIRAGLSPSGYEELARAKVIEPTSPFGSKKCAWSPPAYAQGHGYFRNDAEVVCVDLRETRKP